MRDRDMTTSQTTVRV